ncbi:GDP-Man:Man(3)GlcNAc(2)-PP-Dol alpha-1,2-mannosyltransferase [Neolecta irregularis DAH-3]|uniref:GDP-Man:Man(3)GlcNAc(2)-PP-Dol alpha-1,2-mannosyltransferase n=1 Tax=Neolecta irregularis (strain DAH-3) TaxID=1198029 RepID=A0A1U7LHV8_NEOID|nr:GDP-Man:Man(3)GlcNAc(2)-PP-Dol alpha-1,2-mannosyltransferase [Neolecta irregularis DAH-3]|eukprot:OLL22111.1 GDP-Man:Man(3)GlcNAc(2)-PP-Dol alpha-1,2-mannosyltransferase [Neolecta irregularis DAH-3]
MVNQYIHLFIAAFIIFSFIGFTSSYILFKLICYIVGNKLRGKSLSKRQKYQSKGKPRRVVIGFFHPYCNAGGGGERVLWTAIRDIQKEFENVVCVVYTGDKQVSKEGLIENVKTLFHLELHPDSLHIILLEKRHLVSQESWPRFTMVGQSLGSMILAYEAISKLVPDIFIDTMGYAFTLPLVSHILDIPTSAYIHYPTISSDTSSQIPPSNWPKKLYCNIFKYFYGWAGSAVDLVMTNSSWTAGHIDSSFGMKSVVVYPPCNTESLRSIDISRQRKKEILYLAQYRPEKNHELVLHSFKLYLERFDKKKEAKLILVGSIRGPKDSERVLMLKKQARDLDIEDNIEFIIEASWEEVVGWLRRAWIGVNAMWNEHFGIGIVEYMAAGLIPIVHNSGGPILDIVVPFEGQPTGFHANTAEEFAEAFNSAFTIEDPQSRRLRARETSQNFSEEKFSQLWLRQVDILLKTETLRRRERIYRTGIKED